jgi:aryl-alcohol dehydrogenase-like predicted oxidoreductase
MSLTTKEIAQLRKIISLAEGLLAGGSSGGKATAAKSGNSGRRRSGKELEAFRKMLKQERKSGASVSALAKKHGVTASYIYQIR